MNKTVTINISGIIFHIEEDAYEKLSKYLLTIRGYFSTAEGRDEIMSDIEARIAELLKAKTNANKQVVVMTDVDDVIGIMGKPEDFGGTENEQAHYQQKDEEINYEQVKKTRRVFRDGENKVVGGVCSGIAAYFDLDPLWIRLALVAMFFGFGSGIILYLVLWIIIPEARTTTEKLEMRGEKVDINNISKTVKEDAENFKTRVKDFGNEAKATFKQRDYTNRFVDLVHDIFSGIGNVLKKIIGVILIFIAILLTILLVGSLFGVTTIDHSDVRELINTVFIDPSQKTWLILGSVFLIGIPALMMMYKGIKLLFNFKYYNRWLNMTAGILWLFGLILCFYVGISIGSEFSADGRAKSDYTLQQPMGDTLILKLNTSEKYEEDSYYRTGHRKHLRLNDNPFDWMVVEKNSQKLVVGFPKLDIVPSETDSFELYIIKSSHGVDRKEATERAKRIEYQLVQKDSMLVFNNFFTTSMAEKWRGQEVEILLKVPKNKVIYLDKSLLGFIYDIENVTDEYDGDMLGRRWIMTAKGLKCIDCAGLGQSHDDDFPIPSVPPEPPKPTSSIDYQNKFQLFFVQGQHLFL